MKKRKTVDRLVSDLDQWIARPRNKEMLLENAGQSLRNYLDGKSASAIAALSNMASWLGQAGAHLVLHANLSGWNDIATSLQYLAWNERTLMAMLKKGTAKSIQVIRSGF